MAHVYEKAAELVGPKLAGDGECVALVTIYTSVGPTAIWRPKKKQAATGVSASEPSLQLSRTTATRADHAVVQSWQCTPQK
ncbi:hypothetical protein [Burkholderia sp. AcTa6-5]|nr:hypothetical protein [Burkholderia sp. AcTa6-5]